MILNDLSFDIMFLQPVQIFLNQFVGTQQALWEKQFNEQCEKDDVRGQNLKILTSGHRPSKHWTKNLYPNTTTEKHK